MRNVTLHITLHISLYITLTTDHAVKLLTLYIHLHCTPNTLHTIRTTQATVQKQLAQLLTLRGFVTRRWGTLNLEETVVRV